MEPADHSDNQRSSYDSFSPTGTQHKVVCDPAPCECTVTLLCSGKRESASIAKFSDIAGCWGTNTSAIVLAPYPRPPPALERD